MIKKAFDNFIANMTQGIHFFRLGIATMWEIKGAWVLVYMFGMFVISISVLANTYLRGRLVDEIDGFINETASYQDVVIWIIVAVVFALFISFATSLDAYLSNVLSIQSDDVLQRKALRHAMRLEQMAFDSTQLFPDVRRALTQLRFSLFGLFQNVFKILTGLISVIGAAIIMISFNWWISLIALAVAVPFSALKVHTAHAEARHYFDSMIVDRQKNYYGLTLLDRAISKEIRTFGCASYFDKCRTRLEGEYIGRIKTMVRNLFNLNLIPSVVTAFVTGGILIYIAYEAWMGTLTPGQFVFYSGAYLALHGSLQTMLNNLYGSSYENWLYGRCDKFMKYDMLEREQGDDITPLLQAEGLQLKFDKVGFSYHGSKQRIFDELSFTIEPKEKVAIVGLNGAGKTTLIRLLCGLYSPDKGSIRISGRDQGKFKNIDVYKCFGAVFQDYSSFQVSLRDNIALSDLENKDNQELIDRAAKMGGITDIIHKFPKGYETHLGREFEEDGIDISGGEWQKLALARSYFAKRKILIYDEPTAALDPYSEYTLMDNAIMQNPDSTVIVISHRLSVATLVDRVLFLADGKIVEDGSHTDLMRQNGKYAEMFRSQAKKYQMKDFIKKEDVM